MTALHPPSASSASLLARLSVCLLSIHMPYSMLTEQILFPPEDLYCKWQKERRIMKEKRKKKICEEIHKARDCSGQLAVSTQPRSFPLDLSVKTFDYNPAASPVPMFSLSLYDLENPVWPDSTPTHEPLGHLFMTPVCTDRQMKDQSKKVANLKHKEQVEKKKNAQLMEEARKREDNITESSQQLQQRGFKINTNGMAALSTAAADSGVTEIRAAFNHPDSNQHRLDSLRQKDDRIEELEEALRESVQITAEREMVLAQEESGRSHAEKQMEELMAAMEKVKQELESMKAKLSSTQQSLAEKEAHLTTLRAERRKHLEEVLEMK
ncbi:hypothetical protein EOD39_7289 [Acipenser ruthenus]|uniref:ELKS/Rab6-interacting/CAST family member 1 n=1 Tax=Acipenser ruthenus TaxID=7906 RepID=A0A444U7N2_ACIRT|nr:hypothetical protein EOD39_7289 [Acipenser ruthenus]